MPKEGIEKLRDVKIDQTRLEEELAEQPMHFLYAAEKFVAADSMRTDYKGKLAELEAALDSEVRAKLQSEGIKVTEKMVDAEVKLHPTYKKALDTYNKLYQQAELLRALKESWQMRKDCLIQLAIKHRAEAENLTAKVASL